jgi:RNA polymerase sigma factor (sigma-70 family)
LFTSSNRCAVLSSWIGVNGITTALSGTGATRPARIQMGFLRVIPMSALPSGASTRDLMELQRAPIPRRHAVPLARPRVATAHSPASILRAAPTRNSLRENDPVMTATALKSADDLETRLADWLSRCALGDRQAFRQLYEATSPRLLGVVAQLVGRGALAEDLLQDVYVRIWKAAGQYRVGAGSPMAWMAATARYRAIDHLRSRGARPEVAISDLPARAGSEDGDEDPTHRVPDPAPGPAKTFEARSEAEAVQGCLGTLQGSQQQSISLAYYQGLSHGEIAAHLGAPLGSVKTWVRRGLIALKTCLERCGWPEARS